MNKSLKTLGLASAAAFVLSLSAQAATTTATYNGNGNAGFDGAVGDGMLTFSSDGTTLNGTITNGSTGSGYNDTTVIYVDSVAGGFTTTSGFTDSGTDNLRASISGFSTNTNTRATLNFATGFAADYAIAFGPTSAQFGAVFQLANNGSFTYIGSINISPTGAAGSGANVSPTFTFSLPLSYIGSPTTFNFATTYLDGGTFVNTATNAMDSAYRSNETYGNSITDTTTPTNTNNIGQDTATLGFLTFPVPEPGTWAMMILGGLGLLIGFQRRARRA